MRLRPPHSPHLAAPGRDHRPRTVKPRRAAALDLNSPTLPRPVEPRTLRPRRARLRCNLNSPTSLRRAAAPRTRCAECCVVADIRDASIHLDRWEIERPCTPIA
jgi:hypothetical protein